MGEGGTGFHFKCTEDDPFIFIRQEGGVGAHEEPVVPEKHNAEEDNGEDDSADQQPGNAEVDLFGEIQNLVEGGEDIPFQRLCRFQQHGAERRAERQSIDRGKAERNTHGHGELTIDGTDHPAVEPDRHINRHNNECGGDNGTGDLLHTLDGCFLGRQFFLFHDSDHVFHHHNRVVHQRPDHQDQSEHGQQVHAVPQRIQEDERTENGDGDRQGGDQSRTPVLQEEVGDHNHQDQGQDQGRPDFIHGDADVLGGVIPHVITHALGEEFFQFFQLCGYGIDHSDGVGIALPVDQESHRGIGTVFGVPLVTFCAQFHRGNIAEFDHSAVAIGANNDLVEFFRRFQAPFGIDLHLKIGAGTFRPDRSGGSLDVLLTDRRLDFIRRDVHGSHFLLVQPHAHGVVAGAHDLHVTDAVDTGDFVFHVCAQEVGKPDHVFLSAVFLGERINGKDVAAAFRHVNPQVPDFLRELSFRALDGVLHVHLRDIRIRSGFEFECQVVGTGIGTLRRKVEQVVQPVHFRFDRGCHGVSDFFSTGTGVACPDRDGGRCHFRVFRNGNKLHTEIAGEDHDNGDDHCQFRAFNKNS